MNTILINELSDRMEFTGFYLLKSAIVKQTGDNKSYLDMVITDVTGEMPLKFWDVSDMDKETFFAGSIVKVKGLVSTYREKLQAKVIRIRLAHDSDGFRLSDFVKSAPVPAADLIHVIDTTIDNLKNQKVKDIVRYSVDRVKEPLWSYPAAMSMHHAFYSGLAYHIVRMLELGEHLIEQRPFLNGDLLRAGILLHDLGKILEYSDGEKGFVSEYTVRGNLLGHISMVNNWIAEAALKFQLDSEDPVVIALQHMVLSHHGKLEWGSPVLPQLPEAVALHYIDSLDAKLQAIEDALDTSKDDTITGIKAIDGSRIYRLRLEDE